jgi:hypothetical protein
VPRQIDTSESGCRPSRLPEAFCCLRANISFRSIPALSRSTNYGTRIHYFCSARTIVNCPSRVGLSLKFTALIKKTGGGDVFVTRTLQTAKIYQACDH